MSELAGHADGGHLRSTLNEFEITNAAELEAHVNMNAAAARVNFDKYYAAKLTDCAKLWREEKNRLGVKDPLDTPYCIIDVTQPKFDFSTIVPTFVAKRKERQDAHAAAAAKDEQAQKEAEEDAKRREMGLGAVDRSESLAEMGFGAPTLNPRFKASDPMALRFKGVDYVTVDKVVAALKDDTEVERVDFSDNSLDHDDCEALATLIENNKTITSLNLSGNKIGSDGLSKLSPALSKNTTFRDLDLGANEIAKSGAQAFSAALPNMKLERLQFSANKLGIYGMEILAPGIKECRTLKALGLHNNNLGDDGVAKLLTIFSEEEPSALVQVGLDGNKASTEILGEIEKAVFRNEQHQERLHLEELEDHERGQRTGEDAAELAQFYAMVKKVMAKEAEEIQAKVAKAAPAGKKAPGGKGAPAPKKAPAAKEASAKATPAKKEPAKAPAAKSGAKKPAGKK